MIAMSHRNAAIVAGTLIFAAPALMAQATAMNERIESRVTTVDGKDAGTVTFRQDDHGVIVTARLMNLTPGTHGFHIHEKGACTPDFKAAGGHYNPLKSAHGFDGEGGYHVGDVPNIHVAADGTANAEFFVPQISLKAADNKRYPFTLRDADGSAIMVHAKADDYRTMESSGDRVACGVIAPPRQ